MSEHLHVHSELHGEFATEILSVFDKHPQISVQYEVSHSASTIICDIQKVPANERRQARNSLRIAMQYQDSSNWDLRIDDADSSEFIVCKRRIFHSQLGVTYTQNTCVRHPMHIALSSPDLHNPPPRIYNGFLVALKK